MNPHPRHRTRRGPVFVLVAGLIVAMVFGSAVIDRVLLQPTTVTTRVGVTRSNISVTVTAVQLYQLDNGSLPPALSALVPKYLESLPEDAWGRPFLYRLETGGGAAIGSLGEDGAPGGTGAAADIWQNFGTHR